MKLPFRLFLLILPALLLWQCNDSGTNPSNPQLTFSADPGVIEAWLTVTAEDADGMELLLTRDGVERMRFAAAPETTVVDTGLLPSHSYTYRAELLLNDKTTASQALNLTTMDTTSHDFSWEIFEFPSLYGSGVLRDVAIINENDIWAVGEIYSDSAQPWVPYNAVHWDGQQWELIRITYNGSPWPIHSIFAFSSSDIWFDAFVRWNGNNFIELPIPEVLIGVSINKLWGTDSNNLYVVGGNGTIVHYNGSDWEKIESGTDLPIQDIWSSRNSIEKQWEIIAVASEKYYNSEKKILSIDPETNQVRFIEWPFQDKRIHSVWFKNSHQAWVCGAGVFVQKGSSWSEFNDVPPIFLNRIRGNDINDIYIAGDFGIVAHFNGVSWRVYPEVNVALFESLDYKANVMIAIGNRSGKGYILRMEAL